MTAQKKARLAFLGCGSFTTSAMLPGVATSQVIDVVAVCDIDAQKAQDRARRFGARRWHTDYNEMLEQEELDGVFVIGPAPQQYELAPEVLRRGLPVYVEKPSATTSEQATELAHLAEQNGVWGQVGFMKRFSHVYCMVRDIVARDEFGETLMVNVKFSQGAYPQMWDMDSARRAFLIAQCVHQLDLVRLFGGDVKTVQALYLGKNATQFAYLVNVEYLSGAIGQFNLNSLESATSWSDNQEWLEIVGDNQVLAVRNMIDVEWRRKEDWIETPTGQGRFTNQWGPSLLTIADAKTFYGYKTEAEHFARRCLGEVESGPDLWDSAKALAIGEAIYASAQSGQIVEVKPI